MPLPFSASRGAMLPTMVTSRPSRIQTVPRPITIVQCQRDHGRRSSRPGTEVLIVFVGALIVEPPFHDRQYPRVIAHKRVPHWGPTTTTGEKHGRVGRQAHRVPGGELWRGGGRT